MRSECCIYISIIGSNVSFPYLSQPSDFEVTCKITTAYFPCELNIKLAAVRPMWIINSNLYLLADKLPNNHEFNGTVLTITNITPEQNNSLYQCVIRLLKDGVTPIEYKSSEGRLIIKQCNGKFTK